MNYSVVEALSEETRDIKRSPHSLCVLHFYITCLSTRFSKIRTRPGYGEAAPCLLESYFETGYDCSAPKLCIHIGIEFQIARLSRHGVSKTLSGSDGYICVLLQLPVRVELQNNKQRAAWRVVLSSLL
jgi:hypothetical protein